MKLVLLGDLGRNHSKQPSTSAKNILTFLMMNLIITTLLLSVLQIFPRIGTVSLEEDLTINSKQKLILDKFKEMVLPILPHEYMKTDIYLIRWLRARDFDLKAAEEILLQNLAWRKDNRIDDIHKENWDQLKRQFQYSIDGVDKAGRPIMYLDIGEWDIRSGVVTGQRGRMVCMINKVLDEANVNIRNLQKDGQNVTQYYLIIDLDGYNVAQHACPTCITLPIELIISYENHFPGACHKIVLINTPTIFQSLLKVFRNLVTPLTRENMFVYGRNKEGQAALLKDIDKDQLPSELGGTRDLANFL